VSAAAHEAGHAVAAWLLNRTVTHLALTGGPLDGPHCVDELPDEPDRSDVSAIADDAVVFAVGVLAAGQSPDPDGAGDYHYLAKLAASVAHSQDEAEAFQRWIVARAEAMANHAHFRHLVAHIAEALERDGELDEDDFEHEMQRADRRYRAQIPDPQPSRVPEEATMARSNTASPALVQCREGVIALIDGFEKVARAGDIYPADHPVVMHHPDLFVALGELPDTPRYLPPAA
jgi:hypothetical protein